MNEEQKHICHTCFREFEANQMKTNAIGNPSMTCLTCFEILGKGPGYSSATSEADDAKWLEGTQERKEQLQKEGKI